MLLFAMALAPVFAIICFVISKDKYNKEPFKNLFISFLLGIVSTIPAIILQTLLKGSLVFAETESVFYYAIFAFFVVGVSEEYCKFIMLRYYAYRQKAFDEPLDGIIYGVMVSLGFATLENISYVMTYGFNTALMRMFLSVPAHACFGIIMGYYVGLAKFDKAKSSWLMKIGLVAAIFFHGMYDFFLFLQLNKVITVYVSAGILTFGAILTLYIAVRLSLRAIHLHQELSRVEHERKNYIW